MLFKKPEVFTYYWVKLERSCQVYTAALMSFHSSPFFPDPALPSGYCTCHSDVTSPEDWDPTLVDGWSSATFSIVHGTNALVEAGDIEVSLLGMFVVSESLRESSEGGLEGLAVAAQSRYLYPKSLLCPWIFIHTGEGALEAKSEMSSTCFWHFPGTWRRCTCQPMWTVVTNELWAGSELPFPLPPGIAIF